MEQTNYFDFHGGDVQGYSWDALPADAVEVTSIEGRIIARGETSGHCHILTGDVKMFKTPDGKTFAAVGKDGAYHQHIQETRVTDEIFTINRNISDCDHTKECPVQEGVYFIGLDQQYDPHAELWKKNLD